MTSIASHLSIVKNLSPSLQFLYQPTSEGRLTPYSQREQNKVPISAIKAAKPPSTAVSPDLWK